MSCSHLSGSLLLPRKFWLPGPTPSLGTVLGVPGGGFGRLDDWRSPNASPKFDSPHPRHGHTITKQEGLKKKTEERTAFINKYGLNRQGSAAAAAQAQGGDARPSGGSVLV